MGIEESLTRVVKGIRGRRIPLICPAPRKYRFFVILLEDGIKYGTEIAKIPEEKVKVNWLRRILFALLGFIASFLLSHGLFTSLSFLRLLGSIPGAILGWLSSPFSPLLVALLGAWIGWKFDELMTKRVIPPRFISMALSVDPGDFRGEESIPKVDLSNYLSREDKARFIEEPTIEKTVSIYEDAWEEINRRIRALKREEFPRIGDINSFLLVCKASPRGLGSSLVMARKLREFYSERGKKIRIQMIWPEKLEDREEIIKGLTDLEQEADQIFHADEFYLGKERGLTAARRQMVRDLVEAYDIISNLGQGLGSDPRDLDDSLIYKHGTFCVGRIRLDCVECLEILVKFSQDLLDSPMMSCDLTNGYIAGYFLKAPPEFLRSVPYAVESIKIEVGKGIMLAEEVSDPDAEEATVVMILSLKREGLPKIFQLETPQPLKEVKAIENM